MSNTEPTPRKSKLKFPRVPDFNEDEYEPTPRAFHRALRQRGRERLVAWAYFHWLGEQVEQCYYNEGALHMKNCEALRDEYMMRLNCPERVCPGVCGGYCWEEGFIEGL